MKGSDFHKKVLISLLISILIVFLGKESGFSIYDSIPTKRVYNMGFYYLAKTGLNKEYDSDSFLFPFHFYLFKIQLSPENFARYCKYIFLVATGILTFYIAIAIGYLQSIFLGLFIIASPLYLIQHNWIGFPDHFTFLFSILTLISLDYYYKNKKSIYLFIFFFLLGAWNHFYQFLIIEFLLLSLYFNKTKKIDFKLLGTYIGMGIIAKLSAYGLFLYLGIGTNERRVDTLIQFGFLEWVELYFTNFPLMILSFFNGLLVILLFNLYKNFKQMFLLILIPLLITIFTYDQTRVFSLLFYPAWIGFLILEMREKDSQFTTQKNLYFILLAISITYLFFAPLFYKWGKDIIHLK